MKNKIFYFLLVILSFVLPVMFLRDILTGIACFSTMLAVFGAGQAFYKMAFSSKELELNSFGIGFILFCGISFATANFDLNALYFKFIYIASILYAVYVLINFFRSETQVGINKAAIIIYLFILAFNVYPTLLIQGYYHNNIFSWINTDATVYTSIANQVKLSMYPITIPGFGIEKLHYHYGGYAFAGFIANTFNLSASGSLFGIIRGLAVFSIILSIISIANTTFNKAAVNFRIAGALIGFFFVGSLTSIFEYLPFNFPRVDHGMKHLRGFLIGHSSLWIFMVFIPVISFINYVVIHKTNFNLRRIFSFVILVAFTASLNFIAAIIGGCLLLFFILLYKNNRDGNSFIIKRNLFLIISPYILLLAAVTFYLHRSVTDIGSSLFFLPVFDLGTWSYFLFIFFTLYIGLRVFGLNYIFSKTEIHFGYIQFIILIAALSFMLLLGFFVEPMAGRENDIKYGYVIIQGTFGLFSGLWLAERLAKLWNSPQKIFTLDGKNLFYPLVILFSFVLLIALAGFANSKAAIGFVAAFIRPIVISLVLIVGLLFILYFKKRITIQKNIAFTLVGILLLLSLPGALHEFNKYRSTTGNDESVQLNAADLKLVSNLNTINDKSKRVFLAITDNHSALFPSTYKFSSMINAPVINEGSNYFGVKNKTDFLFITNRLDSFYVNKSINSLKNMAARFEIA